MSTDRKTWDLFCRVVDNYGDVGIAWRLARQLDDGRRAIRLVVDGLGALAKLEPRIDPTVARQRVAGIDVVAWSAFFETDRGVDVAVDAAVDVAVDARAADVVVELLGCGLPATCLDAMEARRGATGWIDYEHLSAEAWIDDFHALPSPHPTRPLVKHFFFPGFGVRTGGLLIEPDCAAHRRAFTDDPAAVASFRQALGIPATGRRLSLFAYPDAPVAALLDALAAAPDRWCIVVPEGILTEPIAAWVRTHGSDAVTVATIPFVDQDDYDRLLWSCEANCVRGEDSFVRAQLAAQPFVWAPYRQADAVHLTKLAAFDDRYEAAMPADLRSVHRRWSTAWNTERADRRTVTDAASAWLASASGSRVHAERWSAALQDEPPLVDRLVSFATTLASKFSVW